MMRHAYGAVTVGAATGLVLGGANAAGMAAMRDAVRARDERVVAGQWQRALNAARHRANEAAQLAQDLADENELLRMEIAALRSTVKNRERALRDLYLSDQAGQ